MSMLPGHLRAQFAQARNDHDWYVEPIACVQSLFDSVKFIGAIHDPCCGIGTIPMTARDYDYDISGADIVNRGMPINFIGVRDFFDDRSRYQNIVSNPPYSLGERFVHHALEFTMRKIAIVMRVSFLAGQKRRKSLFDVRAPALVLVLSSRPSMPPGGSNIPAKGGTADYCWIVWDQAHFGPTILRWA